MSVHVKKRDCYRTRSNRVDRRVRQRPADAIELRETERERESESEWKEKREKDDRNIEGKVPKDIAQMTNTGVLPNDRFFAVKSRSAAPHRSRVRRRQLFARPIFLVKYTYIVNLRVYDMFKGTYCTSTWTGALEFIIVIVGRSFVTIHPSESTRALRRTHVWNFAEKQLTVRFEPLCVKRYRMIDVKSVFGVSPIYYWNAEEIIIAGTTLCRKTKLDISVRKRYC